MMRAFWCLAGWSLLLCPLSGAAAQTTPDEYFRRYLDLREANSHATPQVEGIVEVRGVIQGKVRGQNITWIIREESGERAAFQFVSTSDLPAFQAGARVRALGHGVATPSAIVELEALVLESQMAEWEKLHTAQPEPDAGPRSQAPRVINVNPAQEAPAARPPAPAAPASAPRAGATSPAAAPPVTAAPPRTAAPAAPRPPRWRDPPPAAAAPRPAGSRQRERPTHLASRGWEGYVERYRDAVRWFNPRLPLHQAETIARSILSYSARHRIDPRLVVAVIAVESDFRPTATSPKGAMGLGQLMPGTAAGLGVRNAYDPVENIGGAVRLLRGHLERHSGKPFWEQLSLALASYNAGPGAVRRHGGVPPYRETQNYIAKVGQLYAHLSGYRARR